jgi:hypothetical protein
MLWLLYSKGREKYEFQAGAMNDLVIAFVDTIEMGGVTLCQP